MRLIDCHYYQAQSSNLHPEVLECDDEENLTSFKFTPSYEDEDGKTWNDVYVTFISYKSIVEWKTTFLSFKDFDPTDDQLNRLRVAAQNYYSRQNEVSRLLKYNVTAHGIFGNITLSSVPHDKCRTVFAQCYAEIIAAFSRFPFDLEAIGKNLQ